MGNFFNESGAAHMSNRDDWETPRQLFDELNSIYSFTLDPCSNDYNHKTDIYFTERENGLIQPWDGYVVFANPPYGRNIRKWVEKCYLEALNGVSICLLIPARTDTSYFHDFIYNKPNTRIEFIRGRLKYELNGTPADPSPFPSMLVYFNL